MDGAGTRTEVAICVATCRRPSGLRRLLEGLARLEFSDPAPLLRVVVVDNDPGGEAETVVDELRASLPGPVVLVAEPRRGIPYARNTALENIADASWAAFIDDDEVPDPRWLAELLEVQHKTGADVVTGPVVPHFIEPPPAWVEAGGFFAPQRHPTGTALAVAYTNNVLMCREAAGMRFDEAYALTGGSDSHFFRRLHRKGYTIVWADDACVTDWVPESRTTVGWVVRRSFRVGNGRGRMQLEASPGLATALAVLGAGLLRIVRGATGLVAFGFGPPHRRVQALDTIAAGLGRVAALFGLSWNEYTRIHGA